MSEETTKKFLLVEVPPKLTAKEIAELSHDAYMEYVGVRKDFQDLPPIHIVTSPIKPEE